MKTTTVILRSIKDTLSWNVIKVALGIGIPLAILWTAIGIVLWHPTLTFTEAFIGWVPFSILKANGAFLLGGFVWFSAVLITFALVVSLFNIVIMRKMDQKYYTIFSILLLLVIALGWTLFAFFNWDLVYSEVAKVLTWFPFETLKGGVAAMLVAFIYYNFFIVSLAIMILIFHKSFLKHLQQKEYPQAIMVDKKSHVRYIPVILRDTGIFFLLQILFFPLLFVPFFNVIVQLILWAWLIKESYFLAVGSLYLQKEEVKTLKIHQFILWGLASIGAILNLIPVINIFAPFFTQILFFHWVMLNKKEV